MLYKYRDLSNLQFALDIFVNQRLFASPFENLNDPMEGYYRYEHGMLAQYQVDAIYEEKNRWHLLSLSATHDNMLMWSHYAGSHSGIVVGVEITDPAATVSRVDYVDDSMICEHTPDIALRVLSRKVRLWEYEQEHRAFKRNERGKKEKTFINVSVQRVIFGMNAEKSLKALVTSIVRKFCPEATIETIARDQLRTGRGPNA